MRWSQICARCALVLVFISAAYIASAASVSAQAVEDQVVTALTKGPPTRSEAELTTLVERSPQDAQARLGLGLIQFAGAIERLGQSFYRYGLMAPRSSFLPILRLPVPSNPSPEKLDYSKLRAIYDKLLDDLARVSRTLADLPPGEAKVAVDLMAIRLDLNNDGQTDATEALGAIAQALMQGPGRRPGSQPTGVLGPWVVAFDRADAAWLAGYSNLLSSLVAFTMAHDWSETFNATGHLFFAGAVDASSPLTSGPGPSSMFGDEGPRFADMIAFLHMVRWPVVEPRRLQAVRSHLKEVVRLSRLSWKEILTETDDDREWIPAPKQTSRAIAALPVTQEIVDGWLAVLDDMDAVLDGRKLIPHFRFQSGIDLQQVLEQPRPFDLVLWMTGHAAVPYLKNGEVISWDHWNRWNGMLRGNFLGYAAWFN